MQVRSVQPDEMDVDVTINAVSGADALHSRTFIISSFEHILQAMGQIPGLAEEFREKFDFGKIFDMMLNASGLDSEQIRLSPEEKQAKQQQQQQQQQAFDAKELDKQRTQMQLQLQMQGQLKKIEAELGSMKEGKMIQDQTDAKMAIEQASTELKIAAGQVKQADKTDSDIDVIQAKSQAQIITDNNRLSQELESKLEQIVEKVTRETASKLILMQHEAELEMQNPGVSVNRDDNNVVNVEAEEKAKAQ